MLARAAPLRQLLRRTLSTSSSTSAPSPPPTTTTQLYKYLTPASLLETLKVPQPVERALAIENADATERKQAAKQQRIEQFGLRPGDTGSTPVQVACLTVRIEHMKEHCAAHRQDKASQRAYVALMTKRRNLLQYLRRKDFAAYQHTIKTLELKGFT